jgi:hypothetical protein
MVLGAWLNTSHPLGGGLFFMKRKVARNLRAKVIFSKHDSQACDDTSAPRPLYSLSYLPKLSFCGASNA